MNSREISRHALTALLMQVPRNTEMQVWPLEKSKDGPETLQNLVGSNTCIPILIDAGLLYVKNCQVSLKERDVVLCEFDVP